MNFEQENIRLSDAMTQPLKQNIRSWSVQGLQVDIDELQPNVTVTGTVVMKAPDTNYQLFIRCNINGDDRRLGIIAEFSTLEELQEKHPHLFKLEGRLFAFG